MRMGQKDFRQILEKNIYLLNLKSLFFAHSSYFVSLNSSASAVSTRKLPLNREARNDVLKCYRDYSICCISVFPKLFFWGHILGIF